MNHLEKITGLRDWLADLKLAHLAEAFMACGWRGEKLLELTREELADLGVPKDQRGAVMLAVAALGRGDVPPTLPESQAPTYAPALTEAAIARCQALGQQPPVPWVEAVADTWPGPIAHEFQRHSAIVFAPQLRQNAEMLHINETFCLPAEKQSDKDITVEDEIEMIILFG